MTSYGIDRMAGCLPTAYISAETLAGLRQVPVAKYAEGLGIRRIAVPQPHEDAVALAANAAKRLLAAEPGLRQRIGLCLVATESGVDCSRPISSHLGGMLGLRPDVRSWEIKNACYGGTAALRTALEWQASGTAGGRTALIVCTDIARYAPGSPGEPTQGAGAIAMTVGPEPRLLEIDPQPGGVTSGQADDFFRLPAATYPQVDGQASLRCYLAALENAYCLWRERRPELELPACCHHAPYPGLVRKAQALRNRIDGQSLADDGGSLRPEAEPELYLPAQVGNIYAGSLYLSLMSLLESRATELAWRHVGLFSYGSGFTAEFFTGRVCPDAGQIMAEMPPSSMLEGRRPLTAEQYVSLKALDDSLDSLAVGSFPVPKNVGWAYLGLDQGARKYGLPT